jgi:uncharacterized phage-associated protein
MIRFPFNSRKAAQAAALLVDRHGGTYNYLSLIKLLYFADRLALIETGVPITGDTMVSMPYGPVLSLVKDCLNSFESFGADCTPWRACFTKEGNSVALLDADFATDELSEYEIDVLQRTDDKYGNLTPGEFMDLGHKEPEYEDPLGSSWSIEPETVLEKHGAAVLIERAEEAARILRAAAKRGARGL